MSTDLKTLGTSHQAPGTRQLTFSPVSSHRSSGTSHQAPIIGYGHQSLRTGYRVVDNRHSLNSEQSVSIEPQSSTNKQILLSPLEPGFNTMSDSSIVIKHPTNTWKSNGSTSIKCCSRRDLRKSKHRKRRRYSSSSSSSSSSLSSPKRSRKSKKSKQSHKKRRH